MPEKPAVNILSNTGRRNVANEGRAEKEKRLEVLKVEIDPNGMHLERLDAEKQHKVITDAQKYNKDMKTPKDSSSPISF